MKRAAYIVGMMALFAASWMYGWECSDYEVPPPVIPTCGLDEHPWLHDGQVGCLPDVDFNSGEENPNLPDLDVV